MAPEIIRVVVAVEAAAEGREAIEVEAAMALLVGEGGEQSAAKGRGQLGPAQQGPGEIFDGHQLVVGEAREAESSTRGIGQLARPRQLVAAAAHAKAGISSRSVELELGRGPGGSTGRSRPAASSGGVSFESRSPRSRIRRQKAWTSLGGRSGVGAGLSRGRGHRVHDRPTIDDPAARTGAGTCFKSARNVIQSGAMSAEHADPALEERARRIVETSIELAERGGFEAVRLRDVAAHAGVALGTLYRRFRSKEDLLVAALELETRALAQRIRQRPPKGADASERVVGFFEIATRGMLRRPNLSRAMLRATAAGEPVLAQKVEIFHDLMRGMIVSALRGKPVEGDAAGIADEEQLVGDLLNRVWFALMMSWAGGVQSQGTIALQMRASVELVLARSAEMAIPQAGAMDRVGIQGGIANLKGREP